MLKKNNKGMTLVEIVIVLLIASIAMTITGAILVNSLGYFDDNTKKSLDKQIADGALEYINDEVKYATDVTVTSKKDTKPDSRDDWHCLYIANHQPEEGEENAAQNQNTQVLYRDGNEVFSIDYYSKRNLDIQIKGFTSGEHRLDAKIILNDRNNKQVYKTTNTYELINLNMNADNENTTNFFRNISTDYLALSYDGNDENADNKVLWYIKDTSYSSSNDSGNTDPVNPTPTPSVGGNTVGDQIDCINSKNIGGIYQGVGNHSYPTGLFYYYEGYWWQSYKAEFYGYAPGYGSLRQWKKIDSYYDFHSFYEKGDIVLNQKGVKYIWKDDFPNNDRAFTDASGNPIDLGEDTGDPWWNNKQKEYIKIYEDGDEKIYGKHDCSKYWSSYTDKTVASKLDDVDLDKIQQYKSTGQYTNGVSIVKVPYSGVQGNTANHKFGYQYYLKVFTGDGSAPGTSAASGWEILDRSFHDNSSYANGSIVYYGGTGVNYIRSITEINGETNPAQNVYQVPNVYWERYPKDSNN